MFARLFTDHPRSLGMSWWGHGKGAISIAAAMIAAGLACLIHALIPGLFTETAGRTVDRLYHTMQKRRTGAANPQTWPEYEI